METNDEIKFDHSPSAQELVAAYNKSLESDPTSVVYKRILVKPTLHLGRVLLYVCLTLTVAVGLSLAVYALFSSTVASVLTGVGFVLLVHTVFIKRITIWLVKLYQNIAPESMRRGCRFEPSCSQYMIMAINKYGYFKGVRKGIKRLFRCKPPNGGFDDP